MFLRKSVVEKLQKIQNSLPENYNLKILDAFRPLERQKELWSCKFAINKKKNPHLTDNQIKEITRKQSANPMEGGYGGHQTGGAVDLTLCNNNGADYNMGTEYIEFNEKTKTNSVLKNEMAEKNRKLLLQLMLGQGFINFPLEWWHYCYGDRMWAAYSKKKCAFYAMVEKI